MKKIANVIVVVLVLFPISIKAQQTELVPKPHYSAEAKLVAQILSDHHYKRIDLNDSLSAVVLQDYIESLDNNHTYFLQADIESFDRYKFQIDNDTKEGDLEVAYKIYDVFKKRFDERMNYISQQLIDAEFDFELDEYYEIDRSELGWAKDAGELNDIWRKIIKSQVLSLKLGGKEPTDIKSTIEKRYDRFRKAIDQYNEEDIFELFMNTLAETFDPHTNYFSPKTSERFRQNMSLSLEGIGARLQTENDYTKIVQVLPGGPAEKSERIHENDRIISVGQGENGELVDVIGWRLDDVVQLIKGPKGTVVRLEILPAETGVNGPSMQLTLVREKIKLEDMQAKAEVIPITQNGHDYNIGLITLPSFYMDFEAYQKGDPNYTSTTRDVKRLVGELQQKGIDGLMVDLRNNGGGSLAEAIDLTGLFIKDGPVVQVKNTNNKIEVGKDDNPDLIYDGPLGVLINRFSASASEIFAGAIQDYQRGVVIGEQTFGKGTVQSIVDLGRYISVRDGEKVGQLKLTLQKFYRVTGSSTQHLGVTPDINLPSAFEADDFGESSNPSALPWDRIKGTRYSQTNKVSPGMVSQLNDDYAVRLNTDFVLKELVSETDKLKENLAKTRISLNEAKRKEERDKAEQEEANRNLDGAEINKESTVSNDEIKIDDKYLREGIVILSEFISSIG